MDAREQIVASLAKAFGEARDVSPTGTSPLHVLIPNLELPSPWRPSPVRALAVFENWPTERPKFYVDENLVGGTGQPPESNSAAYLLDQTWRAFSWSFEWKGDDPVRALQLWINRFSFKTT